MTKKEYDPNKPPDDQAVLSIIKYWAVRGLSMASIAAKCGLSLNEFHLALDIKTIRLAYANAKAEFESLRVETRHAILFDPETSSGLKAKMTMDDLRTLESWAPATRTVKVVVEDAANVFQFEALSEQEQTDIKSAHKTNDDTQEDQSKED
jgi:hypothetical protein